jgi:hypothetical protein
MAQGQNDSWASNTEAVKSLMKQAEDAPYYEDAVPFVAEAVTLQLLDAMKSSRVPKSDQQIEALKKSGLHELLVDTLMKGKLTYQAADRHLERMRAAIRGRTISVQDLKNGILAFDDAAQRLALVSGKGGPFQYPLAGNHARDSLITFARSLHR